MAGSLIKSYRFRAEREAAWRDLDGLVGRAERWGLRTLAPDEVLRLPMRYRTAVSSLSVARSISLDASLLAYLETLATRAYFLVYATRAGALDSLSRFFSTHLPRAVRQAAWHSLVAAFILALGIAAGWVLSAQSDDWFYAFVDADMAGGRDPSASTEYLRSTLFDGGTWQDELVAFATFLFQNNARIGMVCFALGAVFGVPVVYLLLVNGMMLGAFVSLFVGRGLGVELAAWLSIHGTTELFALVLCGGAGLMLADGMVRPGRLTRLAALARRGRPAGEIALGCVAMFFIAALLEGLGRQLVESTALRFAIGGAMLALWLAYFTLAGRETSGGDGG